MGQYKFAIPDSDRLDTDALIAAQIVGLEGIPWPGKTVIQDGILNINRNVDISGRLLVPYKTVDHGELAICSGTLPEKDIVYHLDVELARGCLSRLRNQVSIWMEGGLRIDPDFDERLAETVTRFSNVVFLPLGIERSRMCEKIIDDAVDLMFMITDEFSRQIAAIHNTQPKSVPVIAGCVQDNTTGRHDSQTATNGRLDAIDAFAIQRMMQPLTGGEGEQLEIDFLPMDPVVDWLNDPASESVRIAGPLLQFDNTQLPEWMPESGTFEERLNAAKLFCRKFADRFQKRVKILHVTSGLSGVGHQHFNYPQQLQMTLEMLETLDQKMPNTSMMVSFDQPWGERLSMATGGVQAMEIADALLRYGARISAFGLEFNLDYWPQGTLMRDPLQWVDMIDRWSQFGLPMAVYLSAPTGNLADLDAGRFVKTIRGEAESARHQQYLSTVFNFLVRRPAVNVVAWKRSHDLDNRRFPLAGLVDESGNVKDVFQWFKNMVLDVKSNRMPSPDDTMPA